MFVAKSKGYDEYYILPGSGQLSVEDFETIVKIHDIRIMDTATKGTKKLMFVYNIAVYTINAIII